MLRSVKKIPYLQVLRQSVISETKNMNKKKVLITGANGMLAHDFMHIHKNNFHLVALEKKECNICEFESCLNALISHEPDLVLNLAAYTAVDDAQDIGSKQNMDINTIGVYNLAKATSAL